MLLARDFLTHRRDILLQLSASRWHGSPTDNRVIWIHREFMVVVAQTLLYAAYGNGPFAS